MKKKLLASVTFYLAMFSSSLFAKEVKLLLDWTPNTNHTGIYVAKENGWYEGIDLKIIIPGEGDVHKAVASSAADIAVSFQEGMTLARASGIPVVSIAAIIQHNTSAFASRKEKNIKTPADFSNKRYGSFGSPIEKPVIDALMGCSESSIDSVRFIDIGWADFLAVTENDRVDFSWIFYGWTGIDAELKGVELNTVMLSDYTNCVPDYYTPLLMTSEKMIEEQPEVIAAFLEATARGYEFATTNPKKAADILLKHNPELPKELVNASQKWLADKYQADAKQWGWQKEKVWHDYSQLMIDSKIITGFDSKSAFTNKFLPEKK